MTSENPPSTPPALEGNQLKEMWNVLFGQNLENPPPSPEARKEENQADEQGEKEDKKEEASGAHRLGQHYKNRADILEKKGWWWCGIGVLLIFCIGLFYVRYSCWYVHDMKNLKALIGGSENMSIPLSPTTVFASYYAGKILGLTLLTSALIWCARIYSHLRRLKITYRDKEVMANTYYSFIMQHTEDKACHEDVRKYALEHIFKPTLQQMEQGNKDDKSDSIDIATLKTIAELLAPLIKKSE